MRPVGDVSKALLAAAEELTTDDQAPTLRELAAQAQVGYAAALDAVKNLTRAKHLHIPRRRKVDYRNCPVAEYARSKVAQAAPADGWAAWRGVADAFCRRVA